MYSSDRQPRKSAYFGQQPRWWRPSPSTTPCEKLKRWEEELGLARGAELVPVAKKLTPTVRRQFARALQQVDLLYAALQKQQDDFTPKPKKKA